ALKYPKLTKLDTLKPMPSCDHPPNHCSFDGNYGISCSSAVATAVHAGEFCDRESISLKAFSFAGLRPTFRSRFGFISSGMLLTLRVIRTLQAFCEGAKPPSGLCVKRVLF